MDEGLLKVFKNWNKTLYVIFNVGRNMKIISSYGLIWKFSASPDNKNLLKV